MNDIVQSTNYPSQDVAYALKAMIEGDAVLQRIITLNETQLRDRIVAIQDIVRNLSSTGLTNETWFVIQAEASGLQRIIGYYLDGKGHSRDEKGKRRKFTPDAAHAAAETRNVVNSIINKLLPHQPV